MKPLVYADYCLRTEPGAGLSEMALSASVLMRSLHAAFTQIPDRFALGFPYLDDRLPQRKLSVFRVFAESQSDLNELYSIIKNGPGDALNRLFDVRYPETVPVGFAGPWKAFKRARIHSRQMADSRAKTMRQLDEEGTAWLNMGSSSQSHRFRMYIKSMPGPVESPETGGATNSYGLSIADQPVYLPQL